jgi:hypothetical protein
MLLSPKYTAWRRTARLAFQSFIIGAFLLAAHPQIFALPGDHLERESRWVSLDGFLGGAVVSRSGKNSDDQSRGNFLVFRLPDDAQVHLAFLLGSRETHQPLQPTVARSLSIRSPPADLLKSSH